MKLCSLLCLKECEVVSATGGGGKTTLLFHLGRELFNEGKRVLIAPTTRIYAPLVESISIQLVPDDEFLDLSVPIDLRSKLKVLAKGFSQGSYEKNKLVGLKVKTIDAMFRLKKADYFLVEADGARGKSIKMPSKNEPCVPSSSTVVLGVLGLDAFGKPLRDKVFHRLEELLTRYPQNTGEIDMGVITTVINCKEGLFKDSPPGAKKVLILNKIDDNHRYDIAVRLARKVMAQRSGVVPDKVIFSSFFKSKPYFERYP